MPLIRNDSVERQLGRESERQSHEATPLLGVRGIDHFGSKRASLCFARSSTANFNPLFTRHFIAHVRDKDPVLTSLLYAVDHHLVASAYAVPVGGAHEVPLTSDLRALLHP